MAQGNKRNMDVAQSPFDVPLPSTNKGFIGVKPVSWTRKNIGGILVTVYGLEELTQNASNTTCFWLLHGRGEQQDSMSSIAAGLIHAWAAKRQQPSVNKGLIFVTLDQRNHGTRLVNDLNNQSWKQGNVTHAQDMFSTYTGTAHDVSLLLSQLPSYLPANVIITDNICGGVSLGGHATWVALINEPRVSAGLVIVGCPDYAQLMSDRAIRSKVATTLDTDPPGRDFFGSKDFPPSLIAELQRNDPTGTFFGDPRTSTVKDRSRPPTDGEIQHSRKVAERTLASKKVLCLFGGKDRLVPYEQSASFLTWLKRATDAQTGWLNHLGIEVEEFTDPEARHELSPSMRQEAERWLCGYLSNVTRPSLRQSRI